MKTLPIALSLAVFLCSPMSKGEESGIKHTGRAARPVPGYSRMDIEDVIQQKVEFHEKTNVAMSPNGIYGYEMASVKRKESRFTDLTMRVATGDGGYVIKMEGIYWRCAAKWRGQLLARRPQ